MAQLDDPRLLTAMRSYLRAIDDFAHVTRSDEVAIVERGDAVTLAKLALWHRLEEVGWVSAGHDQRQTRNPVGSRGERTGADPAG
ncbi:MAG TPA: hypothetical protein VNG13_12355 [Mycobacteriales bacterium]|nr:hypothetical protein [Mycobacteriales bacterium]